jgi:hypothetical protein
VEMGGGGAGGVLFYEQFEGSSRGGGADWCVRAEDGEPCSRGCVLGEDCGWSPLSAFKNPEESAVVEEIGW